MLGYARERREYRIYDIKNQKVIEERSVKFNEYLKGSNYLGEIENETWDIDSFFEVSPERNEINHNPEKRHYNLAKRVLRYLMGSKDKKLFYENEFGILNASWGNAENGKSFSGGVVLLGNSLILWKCRKQKSVSLSTCEAELFSISEISKDIIWTVNLLTELKCEQFINNAVTLNSDSQAAIQWIKGSRSSNKSRHMNLRFHFIKDLIEDTVIKLEYVQTEFLIADFLTKAMNVEKLEYSMQKIALLS
ncbi:retrovirus-related Pol polyprotein from transposon TNT 1-94 [Trichonephila clavipes]|nr:retrovirus-related Pol polyprotein from transposon TNT 1-94 [Trichonephila clavipes]